MSLTKLYKATALNDKRSKYTQAVFSNLALLIVAAFAIWWFNPGHVAHNFPSFHFVDVIFFLLVSYIIWHPILMEVLTWSISSYIKDLPVKKPVPGLRVAFITTIVPKNEPPSLLHKCLPAMVKAKYPHDTWLLDEGDDPEVKQICFQYGVKHFSRFGNAKYNTPAGKYTKTKGGNHNSWYDKHGNDYDIVAQIDTDFVPKTNFLTKTLGYFRDPKVAFVGTPQIYGNSSASFVAQGADEQQYSFYGSVLRGLSGMGMTLLIGANHVIRVAALKSVNHYTAHITEDLITGMKLHSKGWKSIYVPYPLAIGEGPFTWEAYFNQQMRWAYGCIDILFHYSPRLFKVMGVRRAFYYFFLQQHYFTGVAMVISIFLLSLYFFLGIRAASVDLVRFFIFYSLIFLVCWLMSIYLQRYHIYRTREGELLLSGKILSIAAWPIWFIACLSVFLGKRLNYKVTPKGEIDNPDKTSLLVFFPHLIFGGIATLGIIGSFFTHNQSGVMLFWAFSSAVLMIFMPVIPDIMQGLFKVSKILSINIQNIYASGRLIESEGGGAILAPDLGDLSSDMKKTLSFKSILPKMKDIIWDYFFLSIVVAMSCALYIKNLGFYSDDWSFLGNFTLANNHSMITLFQIATTPNTFMRPVQNLYDALLYWLFGSSPFGYHLVNSLVLLATVLIFYAILRRLNLPRLIALTAPLVFSLLPNYSTDRFWYASFQATLSMMFFFFSLWAGLKALSLKTRRPLVWKMLSIFSLLISALSYEVALPLSLLNMILFWGWAEKSEILKTNKQSKNHTVFVVLNVITLAYIFLFKALTTTRLDKLNYPGDVLHITTSVFLVNYDVLGLNLPKVWMRIVHLYPNPLIFLLTGMTGLIIFVYLLFLAFKSKIPLPTTKWMRNLTLLGFCIFFLGYVIFFTNNKIGFSPTGSDNRVSIAASVGAALSIIGILGWISRAILPQRAAKILFCSLVAILCSGGFLVINTLATFWVSAYSKSDWVLSEIKQQFPVIPSNSTIIIDGVCPYVGPGVVFESQWDLKGALQTIYHDPTIQADIVTPRLRVTKTGIRSQIYTFSQNYPYKNLIIYNLKNKKVYPISNEQTANAYFQKVNRGFNNNCPPGQAGNGVNVF